MDIGLVLLVFVSSFGLAQILHRPVQYPVILDGYPTNKIYILFSVRVVDQPSWPHPRVLLNRVGRGASTRLVKIVVPSLPQDDLPDKVVSSHEISKFAKENNFIYWSFISVKENRNIPESMK